MGQPPALDGVGQDHHGLVMNAVRLIESLENALDVVAPQVGQKSGQLLIREAIQQPREAFVFARVIAREAFSYLAAAPSDEALVLAVRHVVDASSQRLATSKRERGL